MSDAGERKPPVIDFEYLDARVHWGAQHRAEIRDAAESQVVRWEWFSGFNTALEVNPFARWTVDVAERRLKAPPKALRNQAGYGFDDRDRVVVIRNGEFAEIEGDYYETFRLYEARRIVEYDFDTPHSDRDPYYGEFLLDDQDRISLAFHRARGYSALVYDWGPWGVTHETRWHADSRQGPTLLGDEFTALYGDDGRVVEVRRTQRWEGETTEFRVWPKQRVRGGHVYSHRVVFRRDDVVRLADAASNAGASILWVKDRGCYLLVRTETGSLEARAADMDLAAVCGDDDFAHDVTEEVLSCASAVGGDFVVRTRVRSRGDDAHELLGFAFE